MSTDGPGHAAASNGFEAPLALLSACHHRSGRHCAALRRLVVHLASNDIDDGARSAAAAVLQHFDSMLKHQHADEETDLHPALLESMAGSDAVCIRDLIESLALDHRALESHWRRLRVVLAGIATATGRPLVWPDIEPFVTLCERHIAREESELLPMAARLLSDEALDQVGRAMRERRGTGGTE